MVNNSTYSIVDLVEGYIISFGIGLPLNFTGTNGVDLVD